MFSIILFWVQTLKTVPMMMIRDLDLPLEVFKWVPMIAVQTRRKKCKIMPLRPQRYVKTTIILCTTDARTVHYFNVKMFQIVFDCSNHNHVTVTLFYPSQNVSLSLVERRALQRAQQVKFLKKQGLINKESDVKGGAGGDTNSVCSRSSHQRQSSPRIKSV